ncbi:MULTISPECIES: phosphotransferase [Shouchella]|uniref:Phosphotransferase n=1 Tax=Shouchella rhizosphaerae TaxID=866786 RepID=A0ABZ2CYB7_9BACI|nr:MULTISPECIES: phosphotransferase [Shouchella]MCM3380814.1 aminoglycoside phosphotransferase family protein [Shouchella rhizosphaerae]PAE79841.1 hypothetical protein CHH77_18230 [Shouchella clausii]
MGSHWVYKLIVYSKLKNKLMLTYDKNEFSLPSYQPELAHVAIVGHINEFVKEHFQLKTTVLRCCRQLENIRIYEVEILEEESVQFANHVWLTLSQPSDLKKLNSDDQTILKSWIDTQRSVGIPWFHVGWRNQMERWAANVLSNSSLTFAQIRSWERSALFRIISDTQNYYFKAVPDVFNHEPLLSDYLFQHYPLYVPEIVQVEPNKNWYIMREIQGSLLGQTGKIAYWRQAIEQLAVMQKQSTRHIDELKKRNCPVRPVAKVIKSYVKCSFDDLYESHHISRETYQKLNTSIPTIINICDKIEKSNIPLALEHGDFFGGNIMVQNGQPVIYDWSDCTLSHPFLSIMVILKEVEQFFSEEVAKSLLNDYLEKWSGFDSKPHLIEEYNWLKVIAPVYYLTIYQTFIFPAFNDNWDKKQIIEGYITEWLTMPML